MINQNNSTITLLTNHIYLNISRKILISKSIKDIDQYFLKYQSKLFIHDDYKVHKNNDIIDDAIYTFYINNNKGLISIYFISKIVELVPTS